MLQLAVRLATPRRSDSVVEQGAEAKALVEQLRKEGLYERVKVCHDRIELLLSLVPANEQLSDLLASCLPLH